MLVKPEEQQWFHIEGIRTMRNISATRAIVIAFGILTGLAGIEHGFFEMLQGSVAPSGMVIEAIGPAQRFWEYGTEIAMTIVPNFLVTGILAMIVGFALMIWSSAFVQNKYGAHVLAILTAMLLLVGGGFAPIFGAILAIVIATRINKPLTWWSTHIPVSTRGFLAKSWKWSVIVFVSVYLFCIVSGIFGWPLLLFFDARTTTNILLVTGLSVLVFMLYIVLAGFAYDIQKQAESLQAASLKEGLAQ
jgi:hypothetical protein